MSTWMTFCNSFIVKNELRQSSFAMFPISQSDNLRSKPCVNIKQPIRLRLFIISSTNGDFYHIANVSFSGIQAGSSLCLKCARTCLAAGLRPDPLGELKRSPRPLSRNEGPTSKGKGWGIGEGTGGEGGRERRGGEGRGGDEGKQYGPSHFLGKVYAPASDDLE